MTKSLTLTSVVIFSGTLSLFLFAQDKQETNTKPIPLEEEFKEEIKPILQDYCTRCHGRRKQESGVRVDQFDATLGDKQLFLLNHMQKQLIDGNMPPEDEEPLEVEDKAVLLNWVQSALFEGAKKIRPKNGLIRRLTVQQYRNTIRDLLGVKDDLAKALPADGISKEGFKNNKETLLLTPQMMETYFEIAEEALDLCIVDDTQQPEIQCFRVELGAGVNKNPTKDRVVLNGPRLFPQNQFKIYEVLPEKPFAFKPKKMQTKFRFIEGYIGNPTIRAWKDFNGLHHSVYASMIGKHTRGGMNYGRSFHMVEDGLLLRPRSPETENGNAPPRGPAPTFSMPLRELPREGMLQVTVIASRYEDGWQPHDLAIEAEGEMTFDVTGGKDAKLNIPKDGIYQLDVGVQGSLKDDVMIADIGDRTFSKRLKPPYHKTDDGEVIVPVLVARFKMGEYSLKVKNGDNKTLKSAYLTPVLAKSETEHKFLSFEKRVPHLSVHMGVRTDVGARLSKFATTEPVRSKIPERVSFRASLSSFASPDTEKENVNYLAGLSEIAVRSEPTDDRQIPRVLIKGVEIEGPYYESWPPRGHSNIFIPSKNKDSHPVYAHEIIDHFASQAFRRPLKEKECDALLKVWEESYEELQDFTESIKDVLLVVLTSPQFLFLIEESEGPQAEELTSFELATKLSYFLWNSTPDQKLLDLAYRGKLEESLKSEVSRLVSDNQFSQFTEEFVHQWLSLDKFDVVSIDRGRYPKLNKETRREVRREPIKFVEHLNRENLPLRNLVDSDFIVVNDVVAGYYGLGTQLETGYQFAPLLLRTKEEKETFGGVLTQAAILSGLSDGRESNPVKRGAWLADKIISEPPDPPPPDVPELPKETKAKSLRERLEQHRNQKGCMGCHEKIDPWGLPFEHYDAGGLWKKKKVEASSTLPDKTEISGIQDLKRYLANDRIDQVAFSYLKHLAVYATGRDLTFNELEYLRKEAPKALKEDGYRMKDCVLFIVKSPIFMEK